MLPASGSVSTGSSPSTGASQSGDAGTCSRNARRATPGGGFRERVSGKREAVGPRTERKPDGSRKALAPAGLTSRADGLLEVTGLPTPRAPEIVREPAPTATSGSRPATVASASVPPPPSLTNIRIGGAPGEPRIHARIAEGPHAGVEIRAVARDGRVEIELVASDSASVSALRSDAPGLREALERRGLEHVGVDVRLGEHGTGDHHERRRRPEIDPGEAVASDRAVRSNAPIAGALDSAAGLLGDDWVV